MKNIIETLNLLEKLTHKGVVYPQELLVNHNPHKPLDMECLGYLVNGKEAGAYFHWLTLLMKHLEPRLFVELGNRYGSSTIALFHGMTRNQTLITVDIDKDQRYIPPAISQSNQVKFIFGDCIDLTIYEMCDIEIPIDINCLFTDTIHYYEQVLAEYRVYEPLLSDEALIIIDDINLNDKRKFWEEITSHAKYDLTALCHGSGFGVIHYIRPMSERNRTKTERIQLALTRASTIWKNRFTCLYNELPKLENRVTEIRKRKRNQWIRKIGTSILGENLYGKARSYL